MNLKIKPTGLNGSISAISSKSFAHRALICAALSDSNSIVECNDISDDILATVNCLNDIGAKIKYLDNKFYVKPIDIKNAKEQIDCGESGSTLRFLLPIIGALGLKLKIIMHGRLPSRPISPLAEQMKKNGCQIIKKDNYIDISGKLKPSEFEIEGNISSQFISGLLFTIPLINGKSKIIIKNKFESYSYVLLTESVLKNYGIEYSFSNNVFEIVKSKYTSTDIKVEGDWSNAAFWLCASAMHNNNIKVFNLNLKSVQGDRKILDILRKFGAEVITQNDLVTVKSETPLKGITVDASDIPDLVPIICSVACCAEGETRITNAQRLRIKESDRIKSVVSMISNFGGKIFETSDGIVVNGSKLIGGTVDSFNDHRIAMSAAILSTVCSNDIIIKDANAVKKSYPGFYNDFKALGGIITEVCNG